MKFLRSTRKCHFRWLMYLKKKQYNKKRLHQLEDAGYTFINISNFKRIRNIEQFEDFKWDVSKKAETIHLENEKILTKTQRICLRRSPRKRTRKRLFSEISDN